MVYFKIRISFGGVVKEKQIDQDLTRTTVDVITIHGCEKEPIVSINRRFNQCMCYFYLRSPSTIVIWNNRHQLIENKKHMNHVVQETVTLKDCYDCELEFERNRNAFQLYCDLAIAFICYNCVDSYCLNIHSYTN